MRVIAATNRDLEAMMRRSEFREDLYYRLQVIEIIVPPLRERQDEIPQLIEFFVVQVREALQPPRAAIDAEPARRAAGALLARATCASSRTCMKRFVILQDEALLLRELQPQEHAWTASAPPRGAAGRFGGGRRDGTRRRVPPITRRPPRATRAANGNALPAGGPRSLAEVARQAMLQAERDLIVPTLRRVNWNRRRAAPLLGISYKTLLNKIKEQGIVQD